MNRNKLLFILGILIALSIVGICVFYLLPSSEEVEKEKPSVTREKQIVETTKSPQDTTENNHNVTTLEKQLTSFIPLFYNASYAKNSLDKIDDYVTTDFLNK
ncbi:TPA: hypothetical protein ACSJYH_002923, partial [Listeria monocytogenes]